MTTLTAPAPQADSATDTGDPPLNLYKLGMLFVIKCSYWSCRAGNDPDELDLTPDRIDARAIASFGTKDLLDPEKTRKRFQAIEKKARHALERHSRPFTAAGATVDVSVEMVAPVTVGDYSAGWSICQGDNCFYNVTVKIMSGVLPTAPPPQPTEAAQPTAQPTALPTEAPEPTATPAPPAGDYLADGVWRCPGSMEGAAYVGSDKSDKFHYISCRHAKKIEPENRICFASREAAVNYGYAPCGVCCP